MAAKWQILKVSAQQFQRYKKTFEMVMAEADIDFSILNGVGRCCHYSIEVLLI